MIKYPMTESIIDLCGMEGMGIFVENFRGPQTIKGKFLEAFDRGVFCDPELSDGFLTSLDMAVQYYTSDDTLRVVGARHGISGKQVHQHLVIVDMFLSNRLEVDPVEEVGKPGGFASMDPELVRDIASEGGTAAHDKRTAHEFGTDDPLAKEAGRKGGKSASRLRLLHPADAEEVIPELDELLLDFRGTNEVRNLLIKSYESGVIYRLPDDPADHALFRDCRYLALEYFTNGLSQSQTAQKYDVNQCTINERLRKAVDFWAGELGLEPVSKLNKPGMITKTRKS